MGINEDNKNKKSGLLVQAGILAAAGFISRIIGLLYRSPLAAIIGDEGNGYYAAAYNIYSIVLLISSYSIPSAMSKIISQKLALKQYKNAHLIFKKALIYVSIVGGIGSLVLFLGADLFVTGRSAVVLRFFAPTIFVFGFLGVLRGYFQAHRTMIPTSISQLIEQILNAIVSVGGAFILTRMVGEAEELKSQRAMYGAIGSSLGTGSGVLIALLFMLFVYYVNRNIIKRNVERDMSTPLTNSEIYREILTVVTPFIISTFIYNFSSTFNYGIFSRMMMGLKSMEESAMSELYGVFSSKSIVITTLPISMASAVASAMIPEVSTSFATGDSKQTGSIVSRVIRIILMISIPCCVGLFALAKPVVTILFPQKQSIDLAGNLLMLLAVTVIFYSLSTVTNAVLQGIGSIYAPVRNAAIALVFQAAVLVILLKWTDLGVYALAIVAIVYSFLMCLLNNADMRKKLTLEFDLMKTYVLPGISSVVMGVVAYLVHLLINMLLVNTMGGFYFPNLIATMFAVIIASIVYFVVLIKSGGATEEDIRRFPKGASLVRLFKKTKILK